MSFDLSSTTSSDDASVVDISALLPDKNEKGTSSLLFDSSSNIDQNDDNATDRPKDTTSGKNSSDLNEKAPAKKSAEGSDKEDGQNEECQDTIRVVMGESVKNWRRQMQSSPRRSNIATPQRNSAKSKAASNEGTTPIYGNTIPPDKANQPSYIVVQQRDASAKVPDTIDYENSRLEILRHANQNVSHVSIIEGSSTSERWYKADTVKRQFSQHGNQTPPTSSEFVDCIAVWDPQRQVYRLEIPELIASNLKRRRL